MIREEGENQEKFFKKLDTGYPTGGKKANAKRKSSR